MDGAIDGARIDRLIHKENYSQWQAHCLCRLQAGIEVLGADQPREKQELTEPSFCFCENRCLAEGCLSHLSKQPVFREARSTQILRIHHMCKSSAGTIANQFSSEK